MFEHYQKIENPVVVVRKDSYKVNPEFNNETVHGTFYRIVPQNWKEIATVQMLEKGYDKFATASGHGVILSKMAIRKFNKTIQ